MKPNFTLSLSFEGIALLHRAAGGWRLVGEVPLTAPDLKDELAMLRKTAVALEPGGVRCKLLIPNDQIRYLSIDTPDLDDDGRNIAAAAALDGATPYAVADLAFDISPEGSRTHIAAVARETLTEAEAFATEHRFHPVSFVAAPGDNDFLGEPFFGPSSQVNKLLEPGDTVEPDGVAVVVVGTIDAPAGPVVDAPALPRVPVAPPMPQSSGVSDPSIPQIEPPVAGFTSRRSSATPPEVTKPNPKKPEPAPAGFAEQPQKPLSADPKAFKNTPPKPKTIVPPAPPVVQPDPDAPEEERMTVFGARDAEDVGGKPRFLGLILTALLLVFLIAVAAWAAYFLEDDIAGFFGREETFTAAVQEPDLPDEETADTGTTLTDEDTAVLDALQRVPSTEPDLPVLSNDEFAARYAVTGIWPLAPEVPAPPALVSLDDLYLTGIDPINLAFDAVALPDVATQSTDVAIAALRSPAPAGTQFDLDAQGLVKPTRQGALSPEGVRVFAGRPARVPPRTRTQQSDPVVVDERVAQLAGFRPRLRPSGIVETNERSTLGGLTRDELADYRPKLRPVSAQETALASASLFPSEGVANRGAVDDALARDIANAVAVSMRPDARPTNFANIVDRATRAQPEPTETALAVVPQTVAPSIPSSTSVAREATMSNAINLRRVNLIGVYGKPSDRRALVRLANGRYQKVKVGDRIDGGRVSAIGDTELRYQKSGRNVVLKMPEG